MEKLSAYAEPYYRERVGLDWVFRGYAFMAFRTLTFRIGHFYSEFLPAETLISHVLPALLVSNFHHPFLFVGQEVT